MKTQVRVTTLALAAAVFAVACADPATGPSRTLVPDGVDKAITQNVINFPGGGSYPPGVDDGRIILCKTGDAAGTFNFSVSVDGGAAFNVTRTLANAGATDCGTGPIHTAVLGGNSFPQTVVITEATQANWAVANIDIVQHLAIGILNAGNYTAPRLDDSFSVPNRQATVFINKDMARTVTFTNDFTAPPPPVGGLGCTPGYWKQDHHFDSWPSPYLPTAGFNSTFAIGTNWFPNSLTLVQAAGLNGGGKSALARHAVASLLNAATGFSGFTPAQVIAAVQAAYNDASLIETNKNLFAAYNEQRCPLN